MDKLNRFNVCLRAYLKAQSAERNYERKLQEWKMFESDLIERNELDDFVKFVQAENKRDNEYYNHLMAIRTKEFKS